jgi:hypothetical protein
MGDRSVEVHMRHQEEASKFDYFICTVSGALFAYVAQTYIPHRIDLSPALLEPLSLVFLGASFFFGLKRLEQANVVMRLNSRLLDAGEKAGSLTARMLQPGEMFYNEESGEVFDRTTLEKKRDAYLGVAKSINVQFSKLEKQGLKFYNLRNLFLMLGFLTIFAAKVSQPYQVRDLPKPSNSPALSLKH